MKVRALCVLANPRARRTWARSRLSMGIATSLLWLTYTAIYTFPPSDAAAVVTHFIPGILGIAALMMAGLRREDFYLRAAPLSWTRVGAL